MYTYRYLILISSSSYVVILYRNYRAIALHPRMLYLKTETRVTSSCSPPSLYSVSEGSSSVWTRVRAGLTNYARFSGVKLSNSLGEHLDPHYRACGLLVAGRWQTGRKRCRPEAERSRAVRNDLLPSMRLNSRQACSRRSGTVIWNCSAILSFSSWIRDAVKSASQVSI